MPEDVPVADRARDLALGGAPMASIRIVTDSAADLEEQTAAEHAVSIVPLDVRLADFGPDVTSTWSPEEFWLQCAKTSELAETSAPSPGAFLASFTRLADEGAKGIVCVTLSSKLSATYQAAVLGAETIADRVEVRVVDSWLATMAQGLVALDAAAAAEAGGDLDAVSGRGRVQPGPDGALRSSCLPRQPAQGRPPRVGSSPAGRPARHKAGSRGPRRRFGARVTSENAFSLLGARSCQGT